MHGQLYIGIALRSTAMNIKCPVLIFLMTLCYAHAMTFTILFTLKNSSNFHSVVLLPNIKHFLDEIHMERYIMSNISLFFLGT